MQPRATVHFCRFYPVQAGWFQVYPPSHPLDTHTHTHTHTHARKVMLYHDQQRLDVGTWAHGLMLLEMKDDFGTV